jgi:L-iditol 2-dehydrogenase
MGAARVVDAEDEEEVETLLGVSSAAIECAGTPHAWRLAVDLAKPGGRVLFFSGLPSGTEIALDATRLHYAELTCLGTFHFTPADVREAFEQLSFGGVEVRPLITGVESLDRLSDVFERLDRRDGYKYALIPGPSRAQWI